MPVVAKSLLHAQPMLRPKKTPSLRQRPPNCLSYRRFLGGEIPRSRPPFGDSAPHSTLGSGSVTFFLLGVSTLQGVNPRLALVGLGLPYCIGQKGPLGP